MNGHLSPAEISGILDGEVDLDGKGKEHLSSCPRCSALLEEQRKLRRMARAVKPDVPSERMWSAIEDGISREPVPGRSFWDFLWVRPGRVAAGTLGTVAVAALVVIVSRQAVETPMKPVPDVVQSAPDFREEQAPPAREKASPAMAPTVASAPAPAAAPETARPAAKKAGRTRAPAPAGKRKAAPSIKADDAGDRAVSAPELADSAATGAGPAAPEAAAAPAVAAAAAPRVESQLASNAGGTVSPAFRGRRFVLSADGIETSPEGTVKAAGHVIVRPSVPGLAYYAVVDGLSRTLTGEQEGVSAQILQPGERLFLRTK